MGIFDMFIVNHDSILKGFEHITKGSKYIVAYDEDNHIVAYTSGIDVGEQLMDNFIEDHNLDKKYIKFEKEFHKDKDNFTTENEDYQICIVDSDVMLKKDVKELMKTVDLIPYKNNKKMPGLDKFTRK